VEKDVRRLASDVCTSARVRYLFVFYPDELYRGYALCDHDLQTLGSGSFDDLLAIGLTTDLAAEFIVARSTPAFLIGALPEQQEARLDHTVRLATRERVKTSVGTYGTAVVTDGRESSVPSLVRLAAALTCAVWLWVMFGLLKRSKR
jgi:hypothetical protein